MSKSPVRIYEEVIESVRSFNEGLAAMERGAGDDLAGLLAYFRAWYYIPELDLVGPSKFIGYRGMTASEYMETDELDGRVTEPVLSRWFEVVDDRSPEGRFVAARVETLVGRYESSVNRIARFCVRQGWRVQMEAPARPSDQQAVTATGNGSDIQRPIVDVFFRAYQSLYPEDQNAIAELIARHRGH
jgi:hypothetical protein